MNSFEEIRKKKRIKLILGYGLAVLFGIICIILLKAHIEKRAYYIPKADENAESGIPLQVELEELNPEENLRIGFHNPVYIQQDKVYVYLTNYKENEVTISAFLYDEDKNLYAESGMIKQEQYLPYLLLEKDLVQGKEYYINVAFYNMNDMTNEGSIWIRIGEIAQEK
jgi:hypothetical protein